MAQGMSLNYLCQCPFHLSAAGLEQARSHAEGSCEAADAGRSTRGNGACTRVVEAFTGANSSSSGVPRSYVGKSGTCFDHACDVHSQAAGASRHKLQEIDKLHMTGRQMLHLFNNIRAIRLM